MTYFFPIFFSALFFYQLARHSLWHDELQTLITVSQQSLDGFWVSLIERHASPPLYYLVLWIFNPFLQWNELSLRFFSALSALLTLIFLFRLIKNNIGLGSAISACLLISTRYEVIYFSQEARAYSFLMLLTVMNLNLYFEIIKKPEKSSLIWMLIVSNVAILYTHYFGIFFVAAELSMIGIFFKIERNRKIKILIAHLILALPYIGYFFLKDIGKSFSFLGSVQMHDLDHLFGLMEEHRTEALIVAAALISFAFYYFRKERKKLFFFEHSLYLLIIFFFFSYTVSHIVPVFSTRYYFFVFPLEVIVFIGAIQAISENFLFILRTPKEKEIIKAVLILGVSTYFSAIQLQRTFYIAKYYDERNGFPFREAFQAIKKSETAITDKKVIVLEDASSAAFNFYGKQFSENFLITLDGVNRTAEDRRDSINLVLRSEISKTFFLLKGVYQGNFLIQDYLDGVEGRKKIIFNSGNIFVIRYDLD